MNTQISNQPLLKKVLSEFLAFLRANNLDKKLTSHGDIKDFYDKHEWIMLEDSPSGFKREQKFVENSPLKDLSKILKEKYSDLELADIYNILPQILSKIHCFLISSTEKINVDYYYILSDYINFLPKNKKPLLFQEFENHIPFFEEIIDETLSHVNKKYSDFHFSFSWKIPYRIKDSTRDIDIDNRVFISRESDFVIMEGKYTEGYILEKFHTAINDLKIILNILELSHCYRLNDTDKRIGGRFFDLPFTTFDPRNFTYTKLIDHYFGHYILYFEDYLTQFIVSEIGYIDFNYFHLLSMKLRKTELIIASNFFGTQKYRFESQEFLSYWQAIEVMLGSPEGKIKNQLKKKIELFLPGNSLIDDFWDIRNGIVHRGDLYVHYDKINSIKSVAKELLLKLVIAES